MGACTPVVGKEQEIDRTVEGPAVETLGQPVLDGIARYYASRVQQQQQQQQEPSQQAHQASTLDDDDDGGGSGGG